MLYEWVPKPPLASYLAFEMEFGGSISFDIRAILLQVGEPCKMVFCTRMYILNGHSPCKLAFEVELGGPM